MNSQTKNPNDLLPLTPATFHILLSLAETERHGYGIIQDVEARTEGQVSMGPGTLYGRLSRMLEAGLIEEIDERPAPDLDDQRRRYYRLTDFGRKVTEAEAKRLADLVAVARRKGLLGETIQVGT